MASKQHNARMLAEALDAGLIRALDFIELAQLVDQSVTSIEELLRERGFATGEQCEWLAARAGQACDLDATQAPSSADLGERMSAVEMTPADQTSASGEPVAMAGVQDSPSAASSKPSVSRRFPFGLSPARPLYPTEHDSGTTRYRWREKFAEGGLGAVWRADDLRLQRAVAVKEVLPHVAGSAETIDRFLTEARITAQLDHPGVVPVYDLGYKSDGSPFYAMKFLEGKTLADAISQYHHSSASRSERTLMLHRLLRTFVDVCNTAAFAHDRRILHRDLKPRNIMVGPFGETIVLDWGLAKEIGPSEETVNLRSDGARDRQSEQDADESCAPGEPREPSGRVREGSGSRTRMGQMLGTPTYASPEQARGELDRMDARSDIYSLGVILHEILVGRAPWSGRDTQEVLKLVRAGVLVEPRERRTQVPAPLNAICVKAMQAEPDLRYNSALELAEDVNRYLAGEAVRAHREKPLERLTRWIAHHRTIAWVGATSGVVCIGCLVTLSWISLNAWQQERAWHAQTRAAHQAARQAQEAERVAKQEALGNMRTALDSIDQWLLGLSADLEYYPGLSEIRSSWLEKAATHYRSLADAPASDDELAFCRHQALIRLGDVRHLAGHSQEAVTAFVQAERWFERQTREEGSGVELALQLANARIGLGIALTSLPLEQESAQQAFSRAQQSLSSPPLKPCVDERIVSARARLEYGLATWALRKDDWPTARRHLLQSRATLAPMVAASHVPVRVTALYRAVLFDLVRQSLQYQPAQDVEGFLNELITSIQYCVSEEPHRPDHREALMVARILQGNAALRQQKTLDAQQAYRQAVSHFQEITDTLYRGAYHSELLATASTNLAQIELQQGQPAAATRLLEQAKAEFSALVRLHGQEPPLLRGYLQSSRLLADALLNQEDYEGARKQLDAAEQVARYLIALPADQQETSDRMHLVTSLRQRATVESLCGQESAAEAFLQQALEQIESAGEWGRGSTELIEAQADCLVFQADRHWLAGESREAETDYRAARELLANEEREHANLSVDGRQRLAWLWLACPEESVQDRESGERLTERLVQDAGTSPDSWLLLATVHQRAGRPTEAMSALVEAERRWGPVPSASQLAWRVQVLRELGQADRAQEAEDDLNRLFPGLARLPSLLVRLQSPFPSAALNDK